MLKPLLIILLPIQPKVHMTKVFTLQSRVLTHTSPLDHGSRSAIAELPPAPNSVLPCVSSYPLPPPAKPACLSLALPGCAITLPASGRSTGLAVPYNALRLGREGTHGRGSRHPYRRTVSHFPFVAVILVILGGFLWHSSRTL